MYRGSYVPKFCVFLTNGVSGVTHVCPVIRALGVVYDEDVFGSRNLVLGPGLGRDVEDLSVPVPHDPGPGLSRHHAADLRLEAPAALQDVLLQGQDLGGEENLRSVGLSLQGLCLSADLHLYGGGLPLPVRALSSAVVVAGVLQRHVLQLHRAARLPVTLRPRELSPVPRPLDLRGGPNRPAAEAGLAPQGDTHHGLAGLRLDGEGVGNCETMSDGDWSLHHDPALVLATVLLPGRGYREDTVIISTERQSLILSVPDTPSEQHHVLLHPDSHELVSVRRLQLNSEGSEGEADMTSQGMRTVSPGEVVMEDDWLIITGR